MKILYLEPFSGISGDMFMGALLDLGASIQGLISFVMSISEGTELQIREEERASIRGKRVIVKIPKREPGKRGFEDFLGILNRCPTLDTWVREQAIEVLKMLFKAEGRVHDRKWDTLHLHELGSLDTLIDIIGTLFLLRSLEIEEVYSAPLPISRGVIETAHGKMPSPAPAVAVMAEGLPVYGVDTPFELVTPTGIALLKSLARGFGEFPEMVVKRVGHGVGSRDLGERPNLLRGWMGEKRKETHSRVTEIITVMDDITGEIMAHVQEILLEAGALDCYVIPVIMKKGRPGVELHVISPIGHEARFLELIFRETSTIGARLRYQERVCIPRENTELETPWGRLVGKKVEIFGRERVYPEYESAKGLSRKGPVPLIEIYRVVK